MKNLLLILFLMQSVSFASDYQCVVNYAPAGLTVNEKNFDEFAKRISFSSTQKQGLQVTFKGDEFRLWNKNGLILFYFKDGQSMVTFQTSFDPGRKQFAVNMSNDREMSCQSKGPSVKKDPNALDQLGGEVSLYFKEKLTFKYFQQNVRERMRPIIFQDGKLLTNDSKRDNRDNYCVLEAQLKLDENISVDQGTSWPVITMQRLDNSESFYVYSYSFVDIARGKKMIETFGLVAFSFVCNIKKEQKFTPDILAKITNDRVELRPR